jgi:hypothetical protein
VIKAKIVTFHKAHNYGAVLQAYALRKKLNDLGVDVDFYDYSPKWLVKKYGLLKKLGDYPLKDVVKQFITLLFKYKKSRKRYDGFEGFISNHLKSDSINSQAQILFVGSDQIWNPKITGGFDNECFGKIEGIDQAKIVSYAASIEQINLSNSEIEEFKELVLGIDHISVRENSLLEMMKENTITDKPIVHVLDPTLLLTTKEWDEISTPCDVSSDYLLIYENYLDERTKSIANKIADVLGLKIITISTKVAWSHGDEVLNDVSPTEYLSLFKNAKFVITTSYHGLAFAINYRVPFYAIRVEGGVNNRAASLLEILNLQHRMVSIEDVNCQAEALNNIDYSYVHEKLELHRNISLSFINSSF